MRPVRHVPLVLAVFALGIALVVASTLRGDEGRAAAGPYRLSVPLVARDTGVEQPTATATPTRTATATPTRTATPTPTPAPVPAGISARNASWYTSRYTGTIYVVGEVVNNLPRAAEFIKVTARFYSAGNVLLATDFGFSSVGIVPAGGDSPFTILLLSPPPGIASVSVEVTDYTSPPYGGKFPVSGLDATVTNTYVSTIGTLHIVGTVTNRSTRTYRYVQPIVALYNAAGAVVAVDFTFSDPDTLAPGQSATFDLLVLDPPGYARLRLWVDALE